MSLEPPKCELLDAKTTEELLQYFKGEKDGWVLVGPKKWVFPKRCSEQLKGYYNFKARPDDTWVVTYPRSGTTWTQELVWLLSNNMDFETAKKKYLTDRFPFFEFSMFQHPKITQDFLEMNKGDATREKICRDMARPGYEVLDATPSPRFIKSHFPFSLLPGILESGCKIVYVARNPKDVSVSWYHMNKAIKTQAYTGDFARFWNYFQNDLTPWSPYWEHLKEAWALRNHPNVLFMFYEEMQDDFPKAIRKIAKFLGKECSDEDVNKLVDYLNIKNFRNNPMVNHSEMKDCSVIEPGVFVRKGQTGGWREYFTPELESKANKWIEDNLRDTDLRFPHF